MHRVEIPTVSHSTTFHDKMHNELSEMAVKGHHLTGEKFTNCVCHWSWHTHLKDLIKRRWEKSGRSTEMPGQEHCGEDNIVTLVLLSSVGVERAQFVTSDVVFLN